MQQTIRRTLQSQSTRRASRFSIPPFLFITLLLAIGFLLAILAVSTLARQWPDANLSNPFATYAHLFPGQHVDARELETQGFVCQMDSRPTRGDIAEHCSQNLQAGPFSQVSVLVGDGTVRRLNFAARENALMVGHLMLLWVKSETTLSGKSMVASWITYDWVIKTGWNPRGEYDHFQTIKVISFEIAT